MSEQADKMDVRCVCGHLKATHVFSYKGDVNDYCNDLECMCRKYKPEAEQNAELDEELGVKGEAVVDIVEETTTETTITRTTTITFDLPISVQGLIDELNRIATAHGAARAEVTDVKDFGGIGLGEQRLELTIE